jgi:Rad3-related DNA helicase
VLRKLDIVLGEDGPAIAPLFRFVIYDEDFASSTTPSSSTHSSSSSASVRRRVLGWWCMVPGVALQQIAQLGVRSILLTSGTLSPLSSYAAELVLPFPVRLENPHVVRPSQVLVRAVGKGPRGATLNSSFQTRDSENYKADVGALVAAVARLVPGGVLVFFPSYSMLTDTDTQVLNMLGGEATLAMKVHMKATTRHSVTTLSFL